MSVTLCLFLLTFRALEEVLFKQNVMHILCYRLHICKLQIVTRPFRYLLRLRDPKSVSRNQDYRNDESGVVFPLVRGVYSITSLLHLAVLCKILFKIFQIQNKLSARPHDMPSPLPVHRTLRHSSSPYTPLRLQRPARLASSSCGRHEYS